MTYRFYDYGRLDRDGRPRHLDIEKAKENILVPFKPIEYTRIVTQYDDVKETFLADNEDYAAWLWEVKGKGKAAVKKPFAGCYVCKGEGTVNGMPVHEGESFFISRAGREVELDGEMTILCCHG